MLVEQEVKLPAEIPVGHPAGLEGPMVKGIGERKLADFGEVLLGTIGSFCDQHGLSMDNASEGAAAESGKASSKSGERRARS